MDLTLGQRRKSLRDRAKLCEGSEGAHSVPYSRSVKRIGQGK